MAETSQKNDPFLNMIILCAWCGESLNFVSKEALVERAVSHGICQSCKELAMNEFIQDNKQHINNRG